MEQECLFFFSLGMLISGGGAEGVEAWWRLLGTAAILDADIALKYPV